MKYGVGDYFGELALLNNEPRAASVIAITDCKVVSIDGESFKVQHFFSFDLLNFIYKIISKSDYIII